MRHPRESQSKNTLGPLDLSNWRHLLILTMSLSVGTLAVGFVSGNTGVLGIMVTIAVFVNATPQVMVYYQKYRSVKEMEEKFPNFLRDLTEGIRSGLPFHKAIMSTSRNDYGTLTPEVKKMAHQLSWGVTLDKVLERFADRVRVSRRLFSSVKIIRESFTSGGEVVPTLESVAESAMSLEETEKEKKALLNQYVVLMYAISIIFVVIISAINKFLVPIFDTAGNTAASGALGQVIALENPCNNAGGFEVMICGLYEGLYACLLAPQDQKVEGAFCKLQNESTVLSDITVYYTSLFFMMALIQSVLSGLVAGQISEGSIRAGIKHSVILGGLTFGAFLIMIQVGFLGI